MIDIYNKELLDISLKYKLNNLKNLDDPDNADGFFVKFSSLDICNLFYDSYSYSFMDEAFILSNNIHFGIANSFFLIQYLNIDFTNPGLNHRFFFMVESTIHSIYSYWNRVGLLLNFYLQKPIKKKGVYLNNVLKQLKKDYVFLHDIQEFIWLEELNEKMDILKRNEFSHNESLLNQKFTSKDGFELLCQELIKHSNMINESIYDLIKLCEIIESETIKKK